MHQPPAVAWDLASSRWQQRALTVLVLLAALVGALFVAQQGLGSASLALLIVLFAAALVAAVARRNIPKGQLRWDGEQWHWSGEEDRMVRSMACVLDLQAVMLLHLRCDLGKRHWLWLETGDKPLHWKALRRAIVASRTSTPDGVNAEPQEG